MTSDDFKHPFIEKVEVYDCGLRLGVLVRERDGTLTGYRLKIEDVLRHADCVLTSNIL